MTATGKRRPAGVTRREETSAADMERLRADDADKEYAERAHRPTLGDAYPDPWADDYAAIAEDNEARWAAGGPAEAGNPRRAGDSGLIAELPF